jgi:hypothetical protein
LASLTDGANIQLFLTDEVQFANLQLEKLAAGAPGEAVEWRNDGATGAVSGCGQPLA